MALVWRTSYQVFSETSELSEDSQIYRPETQYEVYVNWELHFQLSV